MIAALAILALSQADDITVSIVSAVPIPPAASVEKTPRSTPHAKFFVQFTNHSTKAMNLLSERCSFGYEMVDFEWSDLAGVHHTIERAPRPWYRNVPIPLP